MNRKLYLKADKLLEDATKHWKFVSPILKAPSNQIEYDLLAAHLDRLLDIVGSDENHPLIGLADAVSNLISVYDETHYSLAKTNSISALKYLMEINQYTQSDLHDIGSQGVVSEILNGKRKLNLRQIKSLSKLFNVNPDTFID
jgi:HTH-type transcriptional regulator/antitoxin HigA